MLLRKAAFMIQRWILRILLRALELNHAWFREVPQSLMKLTPPTQLPAVAAITLLTQQSNNFA